MKTELKKTYSLKKIEIKNICFLKDVYWKFGIKKQLTWFKKNVQKNDLHFFIYIEKKLAGYTLLRKKSFFYKNLNKNDLPKKSSQYYLFDTHIIKKEFRKNSIKNLLMKKILQKVKQDKKISFLMCSNKYVKYYKKSNWFLLKKENFEILNMDSKKNGMVYNHDNRIFNKSMIKFCFAVN